VVDADVDVVDADVDVVDADVDVVDAGRCGRRGPRWSTREESEMNKDAILEY
jgi:hypothetical protein